MDKTASQIALLYGLIGLVWITVSDVVIAQWYGTSEGAILTQAQTIKGYGFVLISSLLLYGLVVYFNRHLRRSTVQYGKFFRENPQPMLVYDAESLRFLDVNEAALRTYGYTKAEFLKRSIRDIRPPEDVGRLERILQQDTPHRSGFGRHQTLDGQVFAVKTTSHAIDFKGCKARLVLVAEVDDLVRNEQRVRQLNQQLTEFRFAIGRATIMATIDSEGRLTEVNENFTRISGREKTALLQQPFSFTFKPEQAQVRFEGILTALRNHRIWRGDLPHEAKDGTTFWTQSFFIPFIEQGGQLTHAILIYTDITERKKSEEEIIRREKYLRSLIESQSNYLIRTDIEGKFTFVNLRFKEKFGFIHDHLIGTSSYDTIIPADHEACTQMAMTCLAHPGKIVPIQLRKPHPNGGYYYTDWEFVGIQNEKGEVFEIQGIGQDATERIQNEQHILQQNKRLREIAWISSHELRRPLANMMGLIDLIKTSLPEDQGLIEQGLIEPLDTSARQLDQIIHDIVYKTYEVEEVDQARES